MKRTRFRFLAVLVILCIPFLMISCPDDDDDCIDIQGEWDFFVYETWDCDGQAETEGDETDLLIAQDGCEFSITGTFRKALSGLMTGGLIEDSTFTIEFYDDDIDCTLNIQGSINEAGDELSGTWQDDCHDNPDNCDGESGIFTAERD